MDRAVFYRELRPHFFPHGLAQAQVNSVEAILNYWESQSHSDLRWLAYILATAYHETAGEMLPVEEYGKGRGHNYGQPDGITRQVYYGRGFVQLTWKRNYALFASRLDLDLVNKPDLALELYPATVILIDGMVHGLFTGVSLSDCIKPNTRPDWVRARQIVNGTDNAKLIANYAISFLAILEAATTPVRPVADLQSVPVSVATTESVAVAVPSAPIVEGEALADPWWWRLLTSKIVWVNIITLVTGGGMYTFVDLTPEQRANAATVIVFVLTNANIILRTFFTRPK